MSYAGPSVVLDGGPQYTSAEFKDFMKQWQIEHRVSSPRNPQSNGMAERCVQTMKSSLIKTMEEGEDVNLALLTYKTTPLSHRLASLAELLNSRKYKTLLPTRIMPTRLQEEYRQIMDQGKQTQTQLYNKNTRVLPRLEQSQKVVVQLDPDRNIWTPAEILQCPTSRDGRSYSLKTIHGGVYTRNRGSSNQTTLSQQPRQWKTQQNKEPDPQGLSEKQTDSLSLNKTSINSRNSLETFTSS